MKYKITFSCGHTKEVDLVGPRKERENKLKYLAAYLCPECKEAEKDKEYESARQQDETENIKPLIGSLKQVRWGTVIRRKMINVFKSDVEHLLSEEFNGLMDFFLQKHKYASWYIDNRNAHIKRLLAETANEYKSYQNDIKNKIEKDIELEDDYVVVEATESSHDGCVELVKNEEGQRIDVLYMKDSDFVNAMHEMKLEWNGSNWMYKITQFSGDIDDRYCEIGNTLLRKGFAVKLLKDLQVKTVTADFKPQKLVWVCYDSDNDCLGILQLKRDDEIYQMARKIKNSTWNRDKRIVSVPIERYKEILDFADIVDADITEIAKNKIENYKNEMERCERVVPVKPHEIDKSDKLGDILNQGYDIIDDLRD